MKTYEELAYDAYKANKELPDKHQISDESWMDWFKKGYESATKWYDINDRDNPCPTNKDFLIKLEDGSIRRSQEDWEESMLIVTHWKPID